MENPTASIEPYAAMRRAYSANQSETVNKEEVSSCDRLVYFNFF